MRKRRASRAPWLLCVVARCSCTAARWGPQGAAGSLLFLRAARSRTEGGRCRFVCSRAREQESCRASCARLRGAKETDTTDNNGIFARTPRRVHTAASVHAQLQAGLVVELESPTRAALSLGLGHLGDWVEGDWARLQRALSRRAARPGCLAGSQFSADCPTTDTRVPASANHNPARDTGASCTDRQSSA